MTDTIFTVVVSSITGLVTFFLGAAKQKKEVENMSLQNIQASLDIYKVIIDDLKSEITTLLSRIDELEAKIDEMKTNEEQLRKLLKEKK